MNKRHGATLLLCSCLVTGFVDGAIAARPTIQEQNQKQIQNQKLKQKQKQGQGQNQDQDRLRVSGDVGTRLELAKASFENDEWEKMLAILQPCLAQDPQNADVHYYLSLAQINLGNRMAAKTHQKLVAGKDPARGKELHRLLMVFETLAGLEEDAGGVGENLTASGVPASLVDGLLGE